MGDERQLEDVLARALRPEAAALAQDALDEARAEARRLLVERLTRELVDAGLESLEGPPPPAVPEPRDTAAAAGPPEPDPRSGPPEPDPGQVGWYLFAVGGRGDVDLNGLHGPDGRRAVEAVPEDGLVAFAAPTDLQVLEGLETELPDAEGRLATLARSHDETLRALHERTPVLPMRLATVVRTRQDVEELLRARRPALASQLVEVADADEWTCRVRVTSQTAGHPANEAGEAAETAEAEGEPEAGRAYLSRRSQELRRREERSERLQASLDRLGDRLEAHATASAPLGAGEPGTVFGAAYLVPRGGREAFLETAGAGSEELQGAGAELIVEGPLPPYHFARGDA